MKFTARLEGIHAEGDGLYASWRLYGETGDATQKSNLRNSPCITMPISEDRAAALRVGRTYEFVLNEAPHET